MGGLNVKNTMIERVLQIVAPHPCFSCGKVGAILCEDCKYDIINEPFSGCILCASHTPYGICISHNSPITRAFVVSIRGGALEAVINKLKFEHVKAAARTLSELLNTSLPILPKGILITPVPTVRAHIRQRGYDHAELISQHFAEFRGGSITNLLSRRTRTTQHTEDRATRELQAANAFELADGVDVKGRTVLLMDDIVTTGSTLVAAADTLVKAGAIVWVATLAYQPLD